jgi:hypothetical protein
MHPLNSLKNLHSGKLAITASLGGNLRQQAGNAFF